MEKGPGPAPRPLSRSALAVVLLVGLAGGPAPVWADRALRSVEVVAEVQGVGRTPEQARHEALQRARELAVAEVAGIHVAAQQLRLKSESGGTVRDRFSHLVHTSSEGRIVEEQVVFATHLDGDVPVYRVTLRADVALEEGSRDPGFDVTLETRPASRVLRDGEPLALRLTTTRDCWVTVLDLQADGRVRRLFPNELAAEHHLPAGNALELPGPDRAFQFRAVAPPDPSVREQLLVVATLDPLTYEEPGPSSDELAPGVEASDGLTALNRWLLRIPVDRRVEILWDYEVVE